MPAETVPADTVVGVFVEGKEHAVAVGQMKMSSDEMRTINKGPAIETVHLMGDALWHSPTLP